FLKEVGIIVIGVLVALGAEQVVDSLHWRHKIDQAEGAMRLELAEDNGPQAYARIVAVACFDAQLDQLAALVGTRAGRAQVRRVAIAYQPPYRTWDSQAWQATLASDVGTHMGAEELVKWSAPYRNLPAMDRRSEAEQRERAQLVSLQTQPGPLSDAETDKMLDLISLLRVDNTWSGVQGKLFLLHLLKLGLTVAPQARAQILGEARARFGSCAHEPQLLRPHAGTPGS